MLSLSFGVAYAASAVVFAVVGAISSRREAHNPAVAGSLALVMFAGFWWSAAAAVEALARDPQVAAIAALVIVPAVSLSNAGLLCQALSIARPNALLRRNLFGLCLAEPALMLLAAASNPWHSWLFSGPRATVLVGSADWALGPIFWLDAAYGFVAVLVAAALLQQSDTRTRRKAGVQRYVNLLAPATLLALSIAFRSGAVGGLPDPTPVVGAVAVALFTFTIVRQDAFTYSPVARALIVDQLGDAVVVVSPSGRVLDLNLAAVGLIRRATAGIPAKLVGGKARELFGSVRLSPGAKSEFTIELGGRDAEFEYRSTPLLDRNRRSLGRVYVARDVTVLNAQANRLAAASDELGVANALLVNQNAQLVVQLETIDRLRADLVDQASRDALTELHNRRYLVERFAAMIAAAEQADGQLAVVLVDVDRFKSINDGLGHLVGDALLVALARRMREVLPAGGLLARWGGEEFLVVLPGADAVRGLAFADTLRAECALVVVDVAGRPARCTISGGVAVFPDSGVTMNELFHAADIAMYEAKNAGRNVVRVHTGVATVVS